MTNKTKVTNRKNKTKLEVKWPASYFTIKSLHTDNPDFVEITLRVRKDKAIESGKIVEIGVNHGGKGRPTAVYAVAPVTEQVLAAAREADVMLHSSFESVTVTSVKSQDDDKSTTPVAEASVPAKSDVKSAV